MSYREVIPDQNIFDAGREITLNTGGTQSTLQDIKVSEKANGYCYRTFAKHTRNRFIYWRINRDVLELVEQSLDVNLIGNKIKYRFVDTPILDGINIYETTENVIILVPTVCSVHRLIFPHPHFLHGPVDSSGFHPDLTIPSIFADIPTSHSRDNGIFNVFTNPNVANSELPQVATSLLTTNKVAIFSFSYPSGETLLVKQSMDGSCTTTELKYERFMPRFISGIAEKFWSKMHDGNMVVSMLLHTFGNDTYSLTLCKDGNLRAWCCFKGTCVAVHNLLSDVSNEENNRFISETQNHVLRKTEGRSRCEITLVVFMNFATEQEFRVYSVSINSGQFKIVKRNTLYSPGVNLVDFNLSSSQIWSMWRSEDGEISVYSATLVNDGSKGTYWIPAMLEPIPDANFVPDMDCSDPRQAYLNQIFYPSRFPLHIISKALSIYKPSPIVSEVNLSISILKQRVCLAVESEIQNELKEGEVSDEDYLECAYRCWAKFYSCCVQYHYVAGLQPLGLLLLPSTSGVVLLKKSMYSFLRPHDVLEHMMMCSDYATVDDFMNHPLLSEDRAVTEDVLKLMSVVVYMEQQLSCTFAYTFDRELSQLRSPDDIISELIVDILTELEPISKKLNNCRDIYQAIHKLLELLRIDDGIATEGGDHVQSLNYLFSSQLGVSLVTKCVHQQAVVRFTICRNLLVIQKILLHCGEYDGNVLEAVRSVCLPEVVILTQVSYVMLYLTVLISLPVLRSESTTVLLASLKLNPVFNLKSNNQQTVTLLNLFITSTGGFEAHKKLTKLGLDEEIVVDWNNSLLLYTHLINQLLWPLNGDAVFAEWLLTSGQHIWLQQYRRLLNDWCDWNNCTRTFLLAVSLLSSGEHHKAECLFIKATNGIFTDKFLSERICAVSGSEDKKKAYVTYYLKVIQLFNLHGARDCVINTANTALSIANPSDPHVATLHSIKFKQHLALKHYDEAYDSINANPDEERKEVNIRELIKTLFNRRELDRLLVFSDVGLDIHFYKIIIGNARSTDPMDNLYYDFLYAFFITRGTSKMHMAATVMYEQAFRLQQYNTVEALEKQVKSYLACINVLHLTVQNISPVLRPTDPNVPEQCIRMPYSFGNDDENEIIPLKEDLDVVYVSDVKKELELVSARLRLLRYNPHSLANNLTTPTEVVSFLSNAGIFKYALLLCKTFTLKYDIVFDALTKQCIYLSQTENPKAWNWLIENDLHDLNIVGSFPSNVAWNLLQMYLDEYEEKNSSVLHKVICHRIIQMNSFIPQWILSSYKLRNPSELFELYFNSGLLDDAVEIASEYLLAALGHGKEYYGFTHALSPISPQFSLPLPLIHKLLKELCLQNEENPMKPFEKEFENLSGLLKNYLETAQRVTREMCQIKLKSSGLPVCISVAL